MVQHAWNEVVNSESLVANIALELLSPRCGSACFCVPNRANDRDVDLKRELTKRREKRGHRSDSLEWDLDAHPLPALCSYFCIESTYGLTLLLLRHISQ